MVGMYITRIPNRGSPPAILLREGYRQDGTVKTRTLANLSKLPPEAIELLRLYLKGHQLVPAAEAFDAIASLHHGHVEAVLLTMRRLGFASLLASRSSRPRELVLALVAARILEPESKLATTRSWQVTSLPTTLGVADADELYTAMDWLLQRQDRIEHKLAARHLHNDGLALYDLSSSYFEGLRCPLASLGHNRDGKKGKLQVNYGLLTNARGLPVSVSVFKGNTADPTTLLPEVNKLRSDFGMQRIVLVGKVVNKYQVSKHFKLDIRDDGFDFKLDPDKVAAEAALDGIYVVRTSLAKQAMTAADAVRSYKLLSQVERAFRSFKTLDLEVRPIYYHLERRVRAHIFLCLLAYYVQWHMLEAWRPLLFSDEDLEAKTTRDPVAPARRSEAAEHKALSRTLEDGSQVHSFRTLLKLLSGIVKNICRIPAAGPDAPTFEVVTTPNPKQQSALDLLKTIQL